MTAEPITPHPTNPAHCAVCINLGHKTPATVKVKDGLLACDLHADQPELFDLSKLKNLSRKAT